MKQPIKWMSVIGAIVGALLFLWAMAAAPGQALMQLQTSSAVQIPQALVLAFNAFLFGLLTLGFTWILQYIGLNLLEYAGPLAGTLSAFLLGLVQHWIDVQPISSDPYILMALNILVVIIGGIPVLLFIRNQIR